MENHSQIFTQNGFDIRLSRTDATVIIEAEDPVAMKVYSVELDDQQANGISEKLFPDVHALYQGLIDGFLGVYKDIHLNITPNAALVYSYETFLGTAKKDFRFTIQLYEEDLGPQDKFEKQITKLANKMHHFEKKILPQLEDIANKAKKDVESLVTEKLDTILRRLDELEDKVSSPQFDDKGPYASFFIFSNNNKRVTKTNGNEWYSAVAQKPLRSTGENRFSVQIEFFNPNSLSPTPAIWIGLTPGIYINETNCNSVKGSIFYLAGGTICQNGLAIKSNTLKSYQGTVITVIANVELSYVTFEVNQSPVYHGSLDKNVHDYFPCVSLFYASDSASFIVQLQVIIWNTQVALKRSNNLFEEIFLLTFSQNYPIFQNIFFFYIPSEGIYISFDCNNKNGLFVKS